MVGLDTEMFFHLSLNQNTEFESLNDLKNPLVNSQISSQARKMKDVILFSEWSLRLAGDKIYMLTTLTNFWLHTSRTVQSL